MLSPIANVKLLVQESPLSQASSNYASAYDRHSARAQRRREVGRKRPRQHSNVVKLIVHEMESQDRRALRRDNPKAYKEYLARCDRIEINVDNLRARIDIDHPLSWEERKAWKQADPETLKSYDAIRAHQETVSKMIERHGSRNLAVRTRMREGYHFGGGAVRNYRQREFIEPGFRSDKHPILKRFVSGTRKTQHMLAAHDKAVITQTDSKGLALDCTDVEFNKRMRSIIRLDLDHVFDSWSALLHLIDEMDLPRPNVGTCAPSLDGRIRRPHLYYVLEKAVWFDRFDKRAKRGPMALFEAVARGLVDAFIDMGAADPGGLSNLMRGKNPLSPHHNTRIFREEPWTLTDLSGRVNTYAKLEVMERRHAAVCERLGIPRCRSNQAFPSFRESAFRLGHEWVRNKDPRAKLIYLEDRTAFADALHDALASEARHAMNDGKDPQQAMSILGKVTPWVADEFDPKRGRLRTSKNPGIMREFLRSWGWTPRSDRCRAGQAYTCKVRVDGSIQKIADAMKKVGTENKSAVSRLSGLCRNTVMKHWQTALDLIEKAVSVASRAFSGETCSFGTISSKANTTWNLQTLVAEVRSYCQRLRKQRLLKQQSTVFEKVMSIPPFLRRKPGILSGMKAQATRHEAEPMPEAQQPGTNPAIRPADMPIQPVADLNPAVVKQEAVALVPATIETPLSGTMTTYSDGSRKVEEHGGESYSTGSCLEGHRRGGAAPSSGCIPPGSGSSNKAEAPVPVFGPQHLGVGEDHSRPVWRAG